MYSDIALPALRPPCPASAGRKPGRVPGWTECSREQEPVPEPGSGWGERCGASTEGLRQAGGGPKTSTALRPPNAKEFDIV
jgi:hypothetical protein